MIEDKNIFEDLTDGIIKILPSAVTHAKEDIRKNVHELIQATFDKFDLVTREEFDAQVKVLARTRKKLDLLEKQLTKKV